MKTWTRTAALGLALLAALPLVAACGDDDDDDSGGDLQKVTVMLDWTPNTNHSGIFLAREKGYYRDAGLEVDIVEPGAGAGASQVVAAGTAQFGISVQESVTPARAENVPIVSIAAIIQHNTSSLMSLASDNITRPKDLAGKTYGGFGGPLETEIIKKLVQCDGGDPNSVKFVEVGDVDYVVGFEQNRFDFAWVFDGWDVIRSREILGKQVNTIPFIDYTQCIPDWYTPVIITSEDLIAKQPDTVRKFMEATSRGYEAAIASPKEAADALLKASPESDRKLVELSAEFLASRYVDEGRQWGQQDLAIWQGFEKFARDSGLIDEQVDVSKAFTNDFLPKE